jgi:hypothetical protein
MRAKKPVKKIKLFWYRYHQNTSHTGKKEQVSLSPKYLTHLKKSAGIVITKTPCTLKKKYRYRYHQNTL